MLGRTRHSRLARAAAIGLSVLLLILGTASFASAAPDGAGHMVANRTSVAANTAADYTFTFSNNATTAFAAGSQLTLLVPQGWTQPTTGAGAGHVSVAGCGAYISGIAWSNNTPRGWVITMPMTCAVGASLTLSYTGAQAGAGSYEFRTQSRDGANGTATLSDGSSPTITVFGLAHQLSFSVQPSDTAVGASITPAVTVRVEDSGGRLVETSDASVTISINPGDNPGSSTLSGTTIVAAVNGLATFSNLSLNHAADRYRLHVISTGLDSDTSDRFDVTRANQSISFTSTAPTTATVGGATYTVTATATSGLTVAFARDNSSNGICSVSAGVVSFLAPGTCRINASQAGDADWNAAPPVYQSFAVKRGQTIAFTTTAPTGAQIGVGSYTPHATATSGLTVALTLDASSTGVCTMAAGVVSFTGTGTCTIDANQAGDGTYWAAPQVQQSFTVSRRGQTISFTSTAPADARIGVGSYTPAASATSLLPVTLTLDASSTGVCTMAAGVVSFTGTGTCTINANQAGNGTWAAAPQVQQSFTVSKRSQTISFTNPGDKTLDTAPFALGATATSGMAVSYEVTDGTCTVNAAGTLTIHSTGDCTVTASQAGNSTWNAAEDVSQTFNVGKGNQAITFANPGDKTFDTAPFALGATASSGLDVSYEVTDGTCTVNAGTLTIHSTGDCTVTASQAGDDSWNAAEDVSQTFNVGKGNQTITFVNPGPKAFGTPAFDLGATASSGLDVSYEVTDGTCTVSGSMLTMHGTGDCTVVASQAGDDSWNAAEDVSRTFNVGNGDQSIDFPALPDVPFGTPPFALGAAASSGLAVSYEVIDGTCTVDAAGILTIHGTGDCTVTASQAGDDNWNTAESVSQTFTVGSGDQTITFPAIANRSLGSAPFALGATASSGLAVSYEVTSGTCTVSSGVLTIHGLGDCTVVASQAGDDNWNAAEAVSRSFTVTAKPVLTVTANDQTKGQGEANPVFTFTITGYAEGDSISALSTLPTCTSTADASSPAGTYPITCSGAASNKYDFTYVAGTLTVATEIVAGQTGTPVAPTLPTTNTTPSQSDSGSAPFLALLLCLAFGALGLIGVQAQRRSIRG
jgi:hypothetical protein